LRRAISAKIGNIINKVNEKYERHNFVMLDVTQNDVEFSHVALDAPMAMHMNPGGEVGHRGLRVWEANPVKAMANRDFES
jgi:hypothetical protein